MASDVEICNLGLLRAGVSSTIASLDEQNNTEAALCRAVYAMTRDTMLRAFPWPFARKRISLSLLSEDAPTNWGYSYATPSDCLRVVDVVIPGLRVNRQDSRVPFEVVGTRIYTDQPEAELLYQARITDPTVFDPQFTSALAWALAVEFALALKPGTDLANVMKAAYTQAVNEAWASSMNEGMDLVPECEFLSVRN